MPAARTVKTIPATRTRFTSTPLAEQKKRRTAGYARVSTDSDEQFTSYEAQVDYYTNYIKAREDWEFVEVYTDAGITGTSTKHREGFKRMVEDALAGKIDLIITKSVSRFARNTVDSLTTIRKLKEHGVECFFEKENIWTFDSKGELLLTIMSSLAQEESRSISENCTWGQRKRFADGKVTAPFGRFLGFDRGEDGNLVVNEEQAKVVRRIFSEFLQGMTPYGIAKGLTADGIPTPGGKTNWSATVVKSILGNEKYKGDALLQKSFCVDFLTKKFKVNEGEIPQYYVEHNHEAIIDPDTFDMAQRELSRRCVGRNRHSGVHAFSGKIKCGCCGSWYGSKVWHSTDKYRRVIWQCNQKFKGGEKCTTPHLNEESIKIHFIRAVNVLLQGREEAILAFETARNTVLNVDALLAKQTDLESEMAVVSEMMQNCIRENATFAQNQTEFQRRFDFLSQRFEETKGQYDAVTAEISDKRLRQATMEDFLKALREQDGEVTEFDTMLWSSLVDFATVYGAEDIRFTFKNGQEIQG